MLTGKTRSLSSQKCYRYYSPVFVAAFVAVVVANTAVWMFDKGSA
jgi:hypothetical protein